MKFKTGDIVEYVDGTFGIFVKYSSDDVGYVYYGRNGELRHTQADAGWRPAYVIGDFAWNFLQHQRADYTCLCTNSGVEDRCPMHGRTLASLWEYCDELLKALTSVDKAHTDKPTKDAPTEPTEFGAKATFTFLDGHPKRFIRINGSSERVWQSESGERRSWEDFRSYHGVTGTLTLGWGDDKPAEPRYRVGVNFRLNVYEGNRPVAIFHEAEDAKEFVRVMNKYCEGEG